MISLFERGGGKKKKQGCDKKTGQKGGRCKKTVVALSKNVLALKINMTLWRQKKGCASKKHGPLGQKKHFALSYKKISFSLKITFYIFLFSKIYTFLSSKKFFLKKKFYSNNFFFKKKKKKILPLKKTST